MMTGDRKRIWKRLRFWGGILLLAVFGFGGIMYWSYRKSLGPPATPPGKSREFDEHLAELDDKWLFLFVEQGKILVSDINGSNDKVLLDIAQEMGGKQEVEYEAGSVSPNGDHAAILCGMIDPGDYWPSVYEILLIDVKGRSLKIITPDKQDYLYSFGAVYWLSEDSFIVSHDFETGLRWISTGGINATFASLLLHYRLGEISNPKSVEVRARGYDSPYPRPSVFDETSRAVIFMPPVGGHGGKLKAYDSNGLRSATDQETERFDTLSTADAYVRAARDNVPSISVKFVARNRWPVRILRFIRVPQPPKCQIRLGGRIARVTDSWVWPYELAAAPKWDNDLELFVWQELDVGSGMRSYYMDQKGHYRFWRSGSYVGKVPRVKGEDEEAVE